ncbi:polyketide synthase dehydratase domain-containing protein, partial [Streptomyces albidoflavus]|nr:polyketide synthase dehydratase domain-containing protein [Streptomyces albidoflavus]
PEGRSVDGFGIHPALLDAALHALVGVQDPEGVDAGTALLPFEWTGVELHASGARELRVAVELDDAAHALSLTVTDPAGLPVIHAEGLRLRAASAEQVRVSQAVEHA